ncbi:MAG: hydantoinase/oxoprolinase N-terminal domain-containing protein [Phycisphaeraceae bacterium]
MPAMAKTPHQPRWRIGVDTGGTFCDLVLVDPEGGVRATTKRLSTPDDPGRAVLEGIDRLLARFDGVQSAAEGERARPLNVDDIDQVINIMYDFYFFLKM